MGAAGDRPAVRADARRLRRARAIFGVDAPVRIAAAIVMVALGWALARDLGRFTAPGAVPAHGPGDRGHRRLPDPLRVPDRRRASPRCASRVWTPRTLALGGAITAVVIGLAAQQTLGNLIAGLVLISVAPVQGRRPRAPAGRRPRRPGGGRRLQPRPALHDARPGPGLDHGPEQRRADRRDRAAPRARGRRPAGPRCVRTCARATIQTHARGRDHARPPAASRTSRSRRSTPTRSSSASRPSPLVRTRTARSSPTRCWRPSRRATTRPPAR